MERALSKVVVDSPFAEVREHEGVEVIPVTELAEPVVIEATDPDYEPEIDGWLISYDRGHGGERCDGPNLKPNPGLEVDIDDGFPDMPSARLSQALRRIPDPPIRKFNRSSGAWE